MAKQCLHCHRLATVGERCVFCATAYKVGVAEGQHRASVAIQALREFPEPPTDNRFGIVVERWDWMADKLHDWLHGKRWAALATVGHGRRADKPEPTDG